MHRERQRQRGPQREVAMWGPELLKYRRAGSSVLGGDLELRGQSGPRPSAPALGGRHLTFRQPSEQVKGCLEGWGVPAFSHSFGKSSPHFWSQGDPPSCSHSWSSWLCTPSTSWGPQAGGLASFPVPSPYNMSPRGFQAGVLWGDSEKHQKHLAPGALGSKPPEAPCLPWSVWSWVIGRQCPQSSLLAVVLWEGCSSDQQEALGPGTREGERDLDGVWGFQHCPVGCRAFLGLGCGVEAPTRLSPSTCT